uniref:1-alkyl-2-acetylglycerophosphocholine esterase n=1 Tax=Odontella aurita TaxID=265563 RepID=A0A7S4MQ40_9STRA|mmetsp:Transcript_28404/g.83540  ORF Transcript_28404/g.83540 Transcript_28404/m.83540 type:complete len:469 (+) Transcript_28404:49-1455(+)|eukprot:CAMPEP_0113525378 /NCGR_PEP_ID=MMETSP0015_2-20120614/125_1 /TAXON_ID=2838 /ORGANISM="Odontella" /LENGTH=468 /DNA_ID=CAMNT_0000423531 /DNA_START=49 /DNA_END=1455 /DNA_ORIENTATION=+ /assembly_acc=CAM_ASM_000160
MDRNAYHAPSHQCLNLISIYYVIFLASYCHAFTTSMRPPSRSNPHPRCLVRSKMRVHMSAPDGADILTRAESIGKILGYPLTAAVAFRTGAAAAVVGQPHLPRSLPGPFENVGSCVTRLPALSSSVGKYNGVEGGARVRIFYPCQQNSEEMAPYCTDGLTTSDGMAGLVGFRQLGLSFLLAHLADASSGCFMNAYPLKPPSEFQQGWPLLVYSHGYGGNMDMATYFFRSLASVGIVVAAVEHTDGTASTTIQADGSVLPFSPSLLTGREQLDRRAQEMIIAANAENLPSDLSIDPSAVYLGGHSYGAPTALLAAIRRQKQMRNFKSSIPSLGEEKTVGQVTAGLILHDPALGMGYGMLGDVSTTLSDVPILSYTSDEYNRAGVRCGDLTIHVRGAFHGNFVDAPLWAPSWVMRPLSALIPAAGPSDPVAVHNALAMSASAFVGSKKAVYGPEVGVGYSTSTELFELVV